MLKGKMQLPKVEINKFDDKKVQQLLLEENRFVMNLFAISALPERRDLDAEAENDENPAEIPSLSVKKTRAQSLQELESRLKAIVSKKKLSYKDKLAKKGLKKRMKKKNRQDVRNAQSKLERNAKLALKQENAENAEVKETKPVFNTDNNIVFSKIDFADIGKKKVKKQEKDPKKLLEKMAEEKTKLVEMEKTGDISKVVQIKEKAAWKNALAKAEGQKVKDDPILLKKSVKKKEQKVRASKKKWDARIHNVEKAKNERQSKRTENIEKKKKQKKVKKLKAASKRGKVIPGF
ncbi:surfeit locus protein 6 homolog [Dendroctonus ponderosae]|uniref:Ribosomal RNA-processing protein 14/surfeit locus protein 6 C-terminal domain-containing protein n=1 Tax=Dendroctonus ponderosae TaxID=77166 RepID=J3JZ45_DENPD